VHALLVDKRNTVKFIIQIEFIDKARNHAFPDENDWHVPHYIRVPMHSQKQAVVMMVTPIKIFTPFAIPSPDIVYGIIIKEVVLF
jgi:hypothetical protein